jgi:hypothetical protein
METSILLLAPAAIFLIALALAVDLPRRLTAGMTRRGARGSASAGGA